MVKAEAIDRFATGFYRAKGDDERHDFSIRAAEPASPTPATPQQETQTNPPKPADKPNEQQK
jgi:hypothetical protein